LEQLTAAIGPAGDMLYVPFRITGGTLSGTAFETPSINGTDFAVMYADGKLTHHGQFAVANPAGDIMFWYAGTSQAPEGAYDELLEGHLPGQIPCKLTVQTASTHPEWRSWNRRPLVAVGTFDGVANRLDVMLLSLP
jgi:hypothetical protein